MNLKESFRYQKYLDSLIESAGYSIRNREHGLVEKKKHLKSAANPDVADIEEVVEVDKFVPNDDVIRFMCWLVKEKATLTAAIDKAKASIDLDIDAAIESNKYRHRISSTICGMLSQCKASKNTEIGKDYKFNVEGNQAPYYYTIEVTKEENYDREFAKSVMKDMGREADQISAAVDLAIVETVVDYTPAFDVNESFEDVMKDFVARNLV